MNFQEEHSYCNALANTLRQSDQKRVIVGLLLLAEKENLQGHTKEARTCLDFAQRRLETALAVRMKESSDG